MERGDRFDHPLIERYASQEMARLFSPRARHGAWRDLWIALAQAEHELGFPVTAEQIAEYNIAAKSSDYENLLAVTAEWVDLIIADDDEGDD
jgi:adenylosuccinate lyase